LRSVCGRFVTVFACTDVVNIDLVVGCRIVVVRVSAIVVPGMISASASTILTIVSTSITSTIVVWSGMVVASVISSIRASVVAPRGISTLLARAWLVILRPV
jgi:hypothetical protein